MTEVADGGFTPAPAEPFSPSRFDASESPHRLASKRDGSHFGRVVIWGVGLMGGSLGLALRAAGAAAEVVGAGRRPGPLAAAQELGAVDWWTTDLAVALADADLLVLGAPVAAIIAQADEWAPRLPPGCVATDLGSTKAAVVAAWERRIAPGAAFVGSHPMCGSERAGVVHSRADLYHGAPWILTPTAATPPAAAERVARLARTVGARVVTMDPEAHDRRAAYISHLPQTVAVAAAAAAQAGEESLGGVLALAGGGFRDTTRIAGSAPEIWQDIYQTNREPVLEAIRAFRQALDGLEGAIRTGDRAAIERWFRLAHQARAGLPDK